MNSNLEKKIGIFSGSFDPPHKGHVHISKIFLKKLKLNQVFWSVSKKNPLFKKKYYFNYNQRINLSKKITKKIKKISVTKNDSRYSYQLINFFKKKYKKSKLFFLIGSDNLQKFHQWKNFKSILKSSTLVVISRPGYDAGVKKSFFYKKYKNKLIKNYKNINNNAKKSWVFIKDKGVKISSSKIKIALYSK